VLRLRDSEETTSQSMFLHSFSFKGIVSRDGYFLKAYNNK
jgi:hypothetical protein